MSKWSIMRILSLLPATTEIVCRLGLEGQLVGRSHECDYPDSVQSLPVCTDPKYEYDGTSYEIDQRVKALLQEGLSVYRVDTDLLAALKPDVILTQDHCEVCAASYRDVREAAEQHLDSSVQIVSVAPGDLDGVFMAIQQISAALEAEKEGMELIIEMINSLNMLQSRTQNLPSPAVACLEWIDPLMSSGNWFPELVDIAGGRSALASAGKPSPWIKWDQLLEYDPDLLLISPCGYNLEKSAGELKNITSMQEWKQLKAVRNERVYIMDGHHFFHRPGPRLTESAEILAEIFHPGIFESRHRETGWTRFTD